MLECRESLLVVVVAAFGSLIPFLRGLDYASTSRALQFLRFCSDLHFSASFVFHTA